MGQQQGGGAPLDRVLCESPTLVLQFDRSGTARGADSALLERLAELAADTGEKLTLQDLLDAILAVLPDTFDPAALAADFSHDLRIASPAGRERLFRLRIAPLLGRRGADRGLSLVATDITAHRRADNALARQNASLELLLAGANRANRANDFHQALADCLELICSYDNWLFPGWLVGHAYLVDDRDPDRLVSSNLWIYPDDLRLEPFILLTDATRLRRGVGVPGRVLETGQPIWQGKAASYPEMPRAELADRLGLVALVAIPVLSAERVVAVIELFADDERPPDPRQLEVLAAVGREIGQVYERDFAKRELQRLADHDPLTGLVVMRVARDRIDRALAVAARQQAEVALLFIDLDGFKRINDVHGHDVGDALLRRVAGLLRERVRESDTVARFGGDEFIVLLGGELSSTGAEQVAADILAALELPFAVDGRAVEVGASIGIALCGDEPLSADELIRRADAAMYQAKRAGKHCYRFFIDGKPLGAVEPGT